MKNTSIIVIICLALVSCTSKQQEKLTVSGKIDHAPAAAVAYLEELYLDGKQQPAMLDSVTLKSNGEFSLHTVANEEGIYRVSLGKSYKDFFIINDKNNINIHLDMANQGQAFPVIDGSPATKRLYEMLVKLFQMDTTMSNDHREYEKMKATPKADSLLASLLVKQQEIKQQKNKVIKDFIATSQSPAATCFAIIIASQSGILEEADWKAMVNNAAKKFDNKTVAALQKSMTTTNPKSEQHEYPLQNQQAPELAMKDVNGNTISISSFKGKFLLVDFWASWCGPCRRENPNVVAAYNKFKNKNFTILGVSLDSDSGAWKKAITTDDLEWSHMSDFQKWESSAVKTYFFNSIPFNVLINPEGKIIASNLRGSALEQKLNEVL